jgi:ubiquinone/menaquinone biosynthesis C-methylase UbiE
LSGQTDTDALSFYAEHVLPRAMDLLMRGDELAAIRARVAYELSGEVLEVGFGSGLNVAHYPPAVTRLLAVDPATVGRKLAAPRVAASSVPIAYIGLDGQLLPLPADSVDHALTTWTLCTIPDVERALLEIKRVLRPGGSLHFIEHGRSRDPKVARRQDRLTPVQRRIAGGCRLNRPIDTLIAGSGLDLTQLNTYYLSGLKSVNFSYEGVATKRHQT